MTTLRLKLWCLCSNRWNSAITEYALSTARALAMAGHEVRLVALKDSPALRRATSGADPLATMAVADFSWRGWPRLQRAVAAERPDVLLCFGGAETFLSRFLRGGAQVVRCHGQDLGTTSAWAHRLAHSHVALLLVPSEHLARQVTALSPRQPVVEVALGLDSRLFYPQRAAAEASERPSLVVFGRFDPVKGHAWVIQRTAKLIAATPRDEAPPYLHIVGEEANLKVKELEAAVHSCGLKLGSDVVISPGRVADVRALLAGATLGVVPSLGSEVICRVAEEFLLCGTPVAVSGVGSLSEVLFSGAGFSYAGLSEAEGVAAFHHWIKLSSGESAAAKERRSQAARQRFSLEAMANGLTTALRQM